MRYLIVSQDDNSKTGLGIFDARKRKKKKIKKNQRETCSVSPLMDGRRCGAGRLSWLLILSASSPPGLLIQIVSAGGAWWGGKMSMLKNSVLGLNTMAILEGLVALGAPGKEVAADFNIIVRELAMLVIIHTEKLGLLGSAKLESGDEVDNLGNGGRNDKGVGRGGDNSSNLPSEDDVVAIDEAAGHARVNAIEANDRAGGEEGIEEKTNHASNTVLSKHIEGVVNADEELDYKGC